MSESSIDKETIDVSKGADGPGTATRPLQYMGAIDMEMSKWELEALADIIRACHSGPETENYWDSIEALFRIVSCDDAHLVMYGPQCSLPETREKPDEPIFEKRIIQSPSTRENSQDSNATQILGKESSYGESAEGHAANVRSSGLREIFIHESSYSFCLHIVLLDAFPSEERVATRRQVIFNSIMPDLTESLTRWILARDKRSKNTFLTNREREVLRWIKEGKSTWETSVILGIKSRTVKYHLSNIYRKLDVMNRVQAVAEAIDRGML